MPTVIRADTDQLRAVARQMRTTADQITGGHDGMRQSMDSLDATWSGHARDRGMARWAEIAPKYRPSADGLLHLANELEALAQRLDDAAAVFGAGGGDGGNWYDNDKATDAPQDMAAVFDHMQNGADLQMYQVGENEFVVMLQGSDPLQYGGMNPLFPNALISGMGYSTKYTEEIRAQLRKLASEHPGANINLVGYSQGGIEAQNLAALQDFPE